METVFGLYFIDSHGEWQRFSYQINAAFRGVALILFYFLFFCFTAGILKHDAYLISGAAAFFCTN